MQEWIEVRGLFLVFLQNVALFIILSFLLGRLADRYRHQKGLVWHASASLIFSLAAIVSMLMPHQPVPGVFLDQRNMILLFAGPFGGPYAAIVSGISTAAVRLYLGGVGADAGAGASVSAALLGLLFINNLGRLASTSSALVGAVLLGAVSYPWVVLLGGKGLGIALTQTFAIPYLVLYLLGTPSLSAILMVHRRRLAQEKELANAQRKLEDILDVSTDWFWEVDADLRFTYLSQSYRKVFLRDPDWYIGKRRSEIAAPDQVETALRLENQLRGHKPFDGFRYRLFAGSNQPRNVSISGKPVFDEDNQFVGYRGSGREISDEVAAEEELRSALFQAEAANRAKSEFLSQMSHELRTPLNAIIGFADMMRCQIRGKLGRPEYREDAESIYGAGHHLLSLVNDLLDLSRLEAGKHDLERSECQPADVVDGSIALLEKAADDAGVTIMVVAEDDLVAWLDPRSFKQVVINLVSNAVKFSSHGGHVKVELFQDADGTLVLKVSDRGAGIAEDEIEKVLRPFERTRRARRSAAEGTGLGLPISRALVEAHGGTLVICSRLGVGTQVEVRLPAAAVEGNSELVTEKVA